MKRIYTEWEDIYPLTLVKLRYGGKYVAFNCAEDHDIVQDINNEDISYELEQWLIENVLPVPYGVGTTIVECMNALMKNMNNEKKEKSYETIKISTRKS